MPIRSCSTFMPPWLKRSVGSYPSARGVRSLPRRPLARGLVTLTTLIMPARLVERRWLARRTNLHPALIPVVQAIRATGALTLASMARELNEAPV
jgi:hypothetical protein